jgi:predicted naringenin-chalcone synthase
MSSGSPRAAAARLSLAWGALLEEVCNGPKQPSGPGLLLAMGPGFGAELVLLAW